MIKNDVIPSSVGDVAFAEIMEDENGKSRVSTRDPCRYLNSNIMGVQGMK